MKLRPLNNVLIIEPDPIERHQGLIDLPEKNSLEKISSFATVISCGPRCNYKFKPGQRIFFDRFRDTPLTLKFNGKLIRVIYEDYALGVFEDD